MSYILDALKKSEQERSRGTVPDIKAVHQPDVVIPSRRSSRPYGFLAVMIIIAAGFGYWIYFSSPHPSTTAHTGINDEIAVSPASDGGEESVLDGHSIDQGATENTPQPQSPNQIQLVQNLTALREEAEKDTEEKHAIPRSESGSAEKSTASSAAHNGEKSAKSKAKASRPNVIFSDEPLTTVNGDSTQGVALANRPESANNTTHSAQTGASADTNDVIYDIAELPEGVKRDLPSITFAGHVYSSSKSQRSVMLNGRKMREGEEVAKGLVLDQITMDGVVLRAQGYRFKLGALQDWSFR